MYIRIDSRRVKDHIDKLYHEKRELVRLRSSLLNDSVICSDHKGLQLRIIAEKIKKLEDSVEGRIEWLEDLNSEVVAIKADNRAALDDIAYDLDSLQIE